MTSVFPNEDRIFQQDNDPSYKAYIVPLYFEAHADELQLLCWSPISKGTINYIKRNWDAMQHHIRLHQPSIHNKYFIIRLCQLFL